MKTVEMESGLIRTINNLSSRAKMVYKAVFVRLELQGANVNFAFVFTVSHCG